MKRLISRSGSTVAQVLRISLLLILSFAVVKSNSFAQSAQGTAENSPQVVSLSTASLSEKTPSPETETSAPPTSPEAKSISTPEEANVISQMLQASLEARLKQWQALSDLEQPTASLKAGNDATPDIAFIDQKIAALDRMIKLLEQRQSMQAVAGVYQKRLDEMQRKIEGAKPQTSSSNDR